MEARIMIQPRTIEHVEISPADEPGTQRTAVDPTVLAVVFGTLVVWAANFLGLWWMTTLVGIAIGVVVHGARRIVAVSAVVGIAGWGLGLAWVAIRGPDLSFAIIAAAITTGLLLCASGAWLGAAARRLFTQRSS
jgi:hypothetical protein